MKKGLIIAAVVVLVLIVALVLSLGHIVKAAVNTMGPKLAGVPVTLDHVGINPLTGTVRLKGLIIGNPEGFNTPSAMELADFKLNISLPSLFTDTVVIKEILITGPQITYEKGLKASNLSTLQNNLAPAGKTEPQPETAAPEKKKGAAKKVMIEDFQLNGGTVNVSVTALGGRKLTLPLPPVRMQDIGKKSGGASPAEVISDVLGAITGAVTDLVASAGNLAGDALKDAGGAATGAAKDATGAATDAAKGAAEGIKKGIGGLLGK